MRIDVITIFPDYLAPLELSLIGRARREGLVELVVHDLRVWTHDRHRTVDDSPLGGGAGMVMKPEPWAEAFEAVRTAGREQLGEHAQPLVVFPRSEEHTSELQSRGHLVCRLLLEKKNTNRSKAGGQRILSA